MKTSTVQTALLLSALFLISLTATAQNDQKFINKEVSKVRGLANKIARSKFDSTYVALPEHEWMVFTSFNANASKYHQRLPVPGIPQLIFGDFFDEVAEEFPLLRNTDISTYDMDLHKNDLSVSLGLAYRTIRLKYSFNVSKGSDKQFSAESLGSRFGFMVNYRKSKKMKGDMYNATEGLKNAFDDLTASPDDVIKSATSPIDERYNDYTLLHLQAHYVFNYKHFSYSAGRSASRIQKKSAGSPIALIDFYQSEAKFKKDFVLGENERYKVWKFSVGGGYGYNYTPNAGKVLIHGSVIPSLNVIRHAKYRTTIPEEEYTEYKQKFEQKMDDMITSTPKLTLNVTARLSATWNIDKHYVLGAFGSLQHSNFLNKEDFSIRENFYSGSVWLGYRF